MTVVIQDYKSQTWIVIREEKCLKTVKNQRPFSIIGEVEKKPVVEKFDELLSFKVEAKLR